MKTLAVVVLLAAAIPAVAQQPEITQFAPDPLVWTNGVINQRYGVEMAWDLPSGAWCPFVYWNAKVTGTVMVLNFSLHEIDWEAVSDFVGAEMPPVFFRIVTSSDNLAYPVWTNEVTIHNVGSAPVTNILAGIVVEPDLTQTQHVHALQSGAATNLSFTQAMSWFVNMTHPLTFRVDYFQTGVYHQVEFHPTVLPFTQNIGE